MAVVTECNGCGVKRPLGARPSVGYTTACPDCGSTSYGTVHIPASLEEERERILETVLPVEGIGKQTAEEIVERMVTYDRLRQAGHGDLLNIPGMGSKNARELSEALRG